MPKRFTAGLTPHQIALVGAAFIFSLVAALLLALYFRWRNSQVT